MHAFRLRKADRSAYQPLDPRPQIDVLAFDLLGVCLPHRVLLCFHMPLIGSPAISEIGVRVATAQKVALSRPVLWTARSVPTHHQSQGKIKTIACTKVAHCCSWPLDGAFSADSASQA